MSSWTKYYELGERGFARHQFRNAAYQFQRTLSVLDVDCEPHVVAKVLMKLGACELLRNRFRQADEALRKAIAITAGDLSQYESQRLFVASSCQLALSKARQHDVQSAICMVDAVLGRVSEFGDSRLSLTPLETLGDLCLANLEYEKAERYFRQAYEKRTGCDDHGADMMLLLDRLIYVCRLQDKSEQAEQFRQRSLECTKKKMFASGDLRAVKTAEEHDRLVQSIQTIKGNAHIDGAVKAALLPTIKSRSPVPWF